MIRPQPKPEPRAKAPRKPLARKARLRAKSWMKRRRPRRLERAGSDVARLDWTRSQPCLLWGPECQGRTEAHHAGKNPGVGMKASDDTAVPLCSLHHRQITNHTGPFKAGSALAAEGLRALQDGWIAETQAKYLGHGGRRGA
jgi:hypothetical protein